MLEINLLPWRKQAEIKQNRHRVYQILSAIVFAVLILALIHVVFIKQIKTIQESILVAQDRLVKINNKMDEMKEARQMMNDQGQGYPDLNQILKYQRDILFLLNNIPDCMPSTVLSREIRFDQKTLVIEGTSPTLERVLEFTGCLKKNLGQDNSFKFKQNNGVFSFSVTTFPSSMENIFSK